MYENGISKLTLLSIVIVGLLLIMTGLLYSSFALQEPVRSISFTSEKLNYNEKVPGSFQVEKSAKWIGQGKAQITFDVDTILKTENKNRDIIFVLDVSGSMEGNKLEKVKQDSIELITSLLSDSSNRAALITFDTNSEILSDFTNDKENLINLISSLAHKDSTNYYQALVNVDNILKNYTENKVRDCIVLFLTDGYPNINLPNEETYFKYLKKEYPYIIVNGIQYEMGENILDPIKKISDNQFIADMETLNNVLFDASNVSSLYDSFILTDYIDVDNFYVDSINDIKISQGNVEFNKEEQKITWTIDDLRTGSKPTMTIDVILKEEAKTKELLPTNKKETVVSKIDTIEENVTSEKTPILKGYYQVIYEGNAPAGCTISNIPSSKYYNVFDIVEIENVKPTCKNYQFKKWKIVTSSVKKNNGDYFEMPDSDVVIRAEWSNISLAKSMNGEIYVQPPPVLQRIGSSSYNEELWKYKKSITKIVFKNDINSIPEDVEPFDISEPKDGSVMGYIVPNVDNTSTYTAYIHGDNKIFANEDSSNLFNGFAKLTAIEGIEYLDTSKVTNMSNMFTGCSGLTSLDVSHFDTSNVTNMYYMFSLCSNLTSLDVSKFNTSNVTSMQGMFVALRKLKNLNLINFDTSKVTNMGCMFINCNGLTTLNLSHFDTSNVTNMGGMFYNCSSLTTLDLSNFDTSNVQDMSEMFYNCCVLTSLNINGFNTSAVTDMNHMFFQCMLLTSLDVSHFDTSKVSNMNAMFSSCNNITNLNINGFNTSNVTDMGYMFAGCKLLTSFSISHFDISNVTTMNNMFTNCSELTSLDLGKFYAPSLKNTSYMFFGCSNLSTTINIFTPVSDSYRMFSHAATSSGTQIIVNYTDKSSVNVDYMILEKSEDSHVVKGNLISAT